LLHSVRTIALATANSPFCFTVSARLPSLRSAPCEPVTGTAKL
jgi:hypothetical protein